MPWPVRRDPVFRSHGRHARACNPIYSAPVIRSRPTSCTRSRREAKIHLCAHEQVRRNHSRNALICLSGDIRADANPLHWNRNGDVPRALVRDMYTKSWSAFDRLVAIVPPGGSIGCVHLTAFLISLNSKTLLNSIPRMAFGTKLYTRS